MSPSPQIDDPANRLESWKEIAGYLGREVRTVQLWEKNEGLPIHRHQHARQGSVYAYKNEIDTWRQARAQVAVTDTAPASKGEDQAKGLPSNLRRLLLGVLGVVAVIEAALWTGATTGWFNQSKAPFRGVPLTSAWAKKPIRAFPPRAPGWPTPGTATSRTTSIST